MVLMRAMLIVLATFSASISGAMDAGHVVSSEHEHVAVESMADHGPVCCHDSSERGQSCRVLPALLADGGGDMAGPSTSEAALTMFRLLLTGIEPSGPLDPPRLV
ncbi:hypothetical protein SAMN05444004_11918 [Jannaschia faecimaris]|uniref:Secreted protein n=1 Tax=Jannaschia faecimaris TaxID=1244108 RepID=A0A1H3TR85_9RHOB|nr:hypothetical protein [Jannaschia faecimaris]SDZ52517.1 hypothetical protein SAMN05444004_11918 [Jannaschia faecimaris]